MLGSIGDPAAEGPFGVLQLDGRDRDGTTVAELQSLARVADPKCPTGLAERLKGHVGIALHCVLRAG